MKTKEGVVAKLEEVKRQCGGRFSAVTISDNGTEFVNEEVISWMEKNGSDFRHGLPYKPTTTGGVRCYILLRITSLNLVDRALQPNLREDDGSRLP
jgi:hypothetical protein